MQNCLIFLAGRHFVLERRALETTKRFPVSRPYPVAVDFYMIPSLPVPYPCIPNFLHLSTLTFCHNIFKAVANEKTLLLITFPCARKLRNICCCC